MKKPSEYSTTVDTSFGPHTIRLGDLYIQRVPDAVETVIVNEIRIEGSITNIFFTSTLDGVRRKYGRNAFINLYKPYKQEE